MKRTSFATVGLVVACFSLGCSSSDATQGSAAPQACVPGASAACAGPVACAGYQVCKADGSGFGTCACGSSDAGLDAGADGADAPADTAAQDAAGDTSSEVAPEASQPEAAVEGGEDGAMEDAADPDSGEATIPDAGADALPDASFCPAGMVQVGTFCVDVVEVTVSAYQAWLSTNPAPGLQLEVQCVASNPSFAPDSLCMADPSVCHGAACGSHPVVCIDPCDARAFCEAHGKHLCGKVGGGEAPPNGCDATQNEWLAACSSGTYAYPYGDTYGPGNCNGFDVGLNTTVVAGSLPTCAVGGIHDMSGNVMEWQRTNLAYNVARGGGFRDKADGLKCCSAQSISSNALAQPDIGFRCCYQ
ncbi:MAG: SUMF1/EgtB/PvdO family nonheme iron enzyme [Deltaproteobacteria bacterium]|nr:SUMF1/EgtB/PvdO family nonheme iron enzyme [Deltaproteobacteria bacterium]